MSKFLRVTRAIVGAAHKFHLRALNAHVQAARAKFEAACVNSDRASALYRSAQNWRDECHSAEAKALDTYHTTRNAAEAEGKLYDRSFVPA